MRSPESRARDVAARLTAATGARARTTVTPEAVRVEVDLPEEVTQPLLTAIVAALDTADRYGHDHTATEGTAWAEFVRRPPPTAHPDREDGVDGSDGPHGSDGPDGGARGGEEPPG